MKENMFYGAGPVIFQRAGELRNNMTKAEKIVWNKIHINQWHLKFRRQHPIGNYIADFYCHAIKLVIEIDGDIHNIKEVKELDEYRENHLKELGLTILRFKNEDVFKNCESIIQEIEATIETLQKNSFSNETLLADSTSKANSNILYVVKISGNIIDDNENLLPFLQDFAAIDEKKILIHGGGKMATKLAEQLGVTQQLVDGRRITDAETLKIVTMVYAGYINKNIVAQLQSVNCNAIGLTGADCNIIQAHKRNINSPVGIRNIDYGFAGDIDTVNTDVLQLLLQNNISIILAPLTHDKNGQLLNTNADTVAQEIAKALSALYDVSLIYCFEKNGVLENAEDDTTVIKSITHKNYNELKQKNIIFAGMIPKLDNAFTAVNSGVKKVIIGKAKQINQLIKGESGTTVSN
jgi:acetylglutamate kinase